MKKMKTIIFLPFLDENEGFGRKVWSRKCVEKRTSFWRVTSKNDGRSWHEFAGTFEIPLFGYEMLLKKECLFPATINSNRKMTSPHPTDLFSFSPIILHSHRFPGFDALSRYHGGQRNNKQMSRQCSHDMKPKQYTICCHMMTTRSVLNLMNFHLVLCVPHIFLPRRLLLRLGTFSEDEKIREIFFPIHCWFDVIVVDNGVPILEPIVLALLRIDEHFLFWHCLATLFSVSFFFRWKQKILFTIKIKWLTSFPFPSLSICRYLEISSFCKKKNTKTT